MNHDAAHLAARLAENAEAVCKAYLSNGRRAGHYWLVGDALNNPGRSLFVRLAGPSRGPGAAGKWTDAASGEHGDLLDLIALNRRHATLRETLEEARTFLNEPSRVAPQAPPPMPRNSRTAARRLFAAAHPIPGTLVETYLRSRHIAGPMFLRALRFHPACYYRVNENAPLEAWPAMIAAVTDLSGSITGVQRTWLARGGRAKAPLADPRRAMGELLGHAVRFGTATDVLAAGEGIETVLSLKSLFPDMPMAAALSAVHLAALLLPPALRRLYVVLDNDAAGRQAATQLATRARAADVEAHFLAPRGGDWNHDLRTLGPNLTLAGLARQLSAGDRARLTR
jgi:hypothetical protein